MKELREVPFGVWILLAAVLLLQGTWLFRDAQRRGLEKLSWFWGIWGLTGLPSPTICYLCFVVLPAKRRAKKNLE